MSGRQTRVRAAVNYNEKQLDGDPAWAKQLSQPGSQSSSQHSGKENEHQAARNQQKHVARKPAEAVAAPAGGKKKSSGQAVPARGRNAGVTTLPIVDLKEHKASGSGKGSPGAVAAAAAAVEQKPSNAQLQQVAKEVPGLPGVKQRRLERVPSTAAAAPLDSNNAPAARQQPAAAASGGNQGGAPASGPHKRGAPVVEPAAKRQRSKSSGGSKPAAAAAQDEAPDARGLQRQIRTAGPGPSAAEGVGAEQRQVAAAVQAEDDGVLDAALARAAAAVAAAKHAEEEAGSIAAVPHCQRCQHFANNFAELLKEYQMLQAEYEALKAARLSTDVEDLLKEHNKKVTEHGIRAAELAKQWKDEAEKRAQDAEKYAQLLARCRELEGELARAQAENMDLQEAARAKDNHIHELETRNLLLERRVHPPTTYDQHMQTSALAAQSMGVQAPSPEVPSLSSPGVQMYEAHAMIPEGAPGTVYKKAHPRAAGPNPGSAGAAAPEDATYTMPGTTCAPALAAQLAAAAEHGEEVAQQLRQHEQQQPTGGSDMQLTGEAPQQQVAVQQQQVVEERVPVAGTIAHAAGRAGGKRVAPRPASLAAASPGVIARSPAAPQQQQQQQQMPVGRQPQNRPGSAQLTAESLVEAAVVHRPQPAAQGRARRLSAPPAIGFAAGGFSAAGAGSFAAPLERQLHFTSASKDAPHGGLQVVVEEHEATEAEEGHAQTEGAVPASVPPPPREGAITMLGFEATPCKGGKYIYTDRPSGFMFELGPASPSPTGWGSDEEEGLDAEEEEVCYQPLSLGTVGEALPEFLRGPITIKRSMTLKLVNIITGAMAEAATAAAGQQQRR